MKCAQSTTNAIISTITAVWILGVPVQAEGQADDAKTPRTLPEKDKNAGAVYRDRIVEVLKIESADASELAAVVSEFLRASASIGGQGGRQSTTGGGGQGQMPGEVSTVSRGPFATQIIADPRTNRLIVETTTEHDLEDIKTLVKELDVPVDENRLKTRIYQVKYSRADELASVLQGLGYTNRAAGARSGRTSTRRAVPSRPGSPPSPPIGGQEIGIPQNVASTSRIVPYLVTNCLLIQASPEEHKEILDILNEIDAKRRQVFLEVAIVKVRSGSGLNQAIEHLAGEADAEGTPSPSPRASDPTDPASVVPEAFSTIMKKGDFPALVQFFKDNGDSQVLAHPFLQADEFENNCIDITETRYITQTNTTNATTTSSMQGEDAGITMSVVPTISSAQKAIRLELDLRISEFTETAAAPNTLPPKTESSVKSSLTVPDGQIFVIGGLTRTGRPKAEAADKNNLYVLLRAHVLTTAPAK